MKVKVLARYGPSYPNKSKVKDSKGLVWVSSSSYISNICKPDHMHIAYARRSTAHLLLEPVGARHL